mgnify:CR=1 FL=1
MKVLYCGDVVGRSGREVLKERLPTLIEETKPDWVLVNGENAAAGFGITKTICKDFFDLGVDAITTGNHAFDQRAILSYFSEQKKLIRPLNYPAGTPGSGLCVLEKPSYSGRLIVVQVMGRLYMDPLDDPFASLEKVLEQYSLKDPSINGIFVDIHAETTSEKMALAQAFDGRVSAVIGTHTHIPTADHQILRKGTAFQSDVGMCGDYDSVIGMEKEAPIERFTKKFSRQRLTPASGEATLCAIWIEIDKTTGHAVRIDPIRLGGCLSKAYPF